MGCRPRRAAGWTSSPGASTATGSTAPAPTRYAQADRGRRARGRRYTFTHAETSKAKERLHAPVFEAPDHASLAVVEQAGIRIGEELAVEADDEGRVIVSRSGGETVGDRRRRALDRAAGALPGVWPAGALDELRDEWR